MHVFYSSTIEYRSSELLNKLKNAGVGRRPIVWFAHSLGGEYSTCIAISSKLGSQCNLNSILKESASFFECLPSAQFFVSVCISFRC